jgi:hypothetical protein
MGATNWPGEMAEEAATLFRDGYSFSYIGIRVGKTRSAVGGKLTRMGVTGHPRLYRQSQVAQLNRNAKRRAERRVRGIPARIPKPPPVYKPEPIKRPDWLGLRLIELTNKTCRWPSGHGPYFFCGAPGCDCKNRQPYCPYHAFIAHRFVREAA